MKRTKTIAPIFNRTMKKRKKIQNSKEENLEVVQTELVHMSKD